MIFRPLQIQAEDHRLKPVPLCHQGNNVLWITRFSLLLVALLRAILFVSNL
jgi:hypothetical protein